MKLFDYHFGAEKTIEKRILLKRADPFLVRACDFCIKSYLDSAGILNVLDSLFSAFDALRIRLVIAEDSRVRLTGDGRWGPVEIIDLDSIEEVDGKDHFVNKHRNDIDLMDGLCAKVIVYRSGAEKKMIVRLLCSHLSGDYVTFRLYERYINSILGGEKKTKEGQSLLSWCATCRSYVKGPGAIKEIQFWRGMPADLFSNACKITGVGPTGTASRVTLILGCKMHGLLKEKCRGMWHCRVSDIVSLCIARALGIFHELERVPINLTGHGRFPILGNVFTETGGWLSSRFPLVILLSSKKRKMVEDYRRMLYSVPNWGATFSWISRYADNDLRDALDFRLHSPFTINLQESGIMANRSASSVELDSRDLIVKSEPNPSWELDAASRLSEEIHPFYFVVQIAERIEIVLHSSADRKPSAALDIVEMLGRCLLDYSMSEDLDFKF